VKPLRELSLHDEYRTEVTGLGEIYERMSCQLLMQRLRRVFPGDYVITFLSKTEASPDLLRSISDRPTVIASGFADIPPWSSGYRPIKHTSGVAPLLKFASLAKPFLRMLASLEPWYPHAVKARKAHIVWFLRSSWDLNKCTLGLLGSQGGT